MLHFSKNKGDMGNPVPSKEQCLEVAGILKTLAHPQRLLILCHLSSAEKTVGELEELCGASQSAVSQFLSRMRLEGLVDSRRDKHHIHYSMKDEKIRKLILELQKIFCF